MIDYRRNIDNKLDKMRAESVTNVGGGDNKKQHQSQSRVATRGETTKLILDANNFTGSCKTGGVMNNSTIIAAIDVHERLFSLSKNKKSLNNSISSNQLLQSRVGLE